jgi:hypothetical protein
MFLRPLLDNPELNKQLKFELPKAVEVPLDCKYLMIKYKTKNNNKGIFSLLAKVHLSLFVP